MEKVGCSQRFFRNTVTRISGQPFQQGENLFGFTGDQKISTAFDKWYAEEGEYDYKKNKYVSQAGNFTQLVWAGKRFSDVWFNHYCKRLFKCIYQSCLHSENVTYV